MNKLNKVIIAFIILVMLSNITLALQQTSGAINLNVTPGTQTFAKYGIRNEGNETINIKLSVNGSVANYINFPSELVLNSSELKYVNISTNIPANYSGSRYLNGTIYALKEGSKGGQVQLNIRLGKNIALNIIEKQKDLLSSPSKPLPDWLILSLIFIVIAVSTAMYMINKNKNTGDEKIE